MLFIIFIHRYNLLFKESHFPIFPRLSFHFSLRFLKFYERYIIKRLTDKNSRRWIFEIATQKRLSARRCTLERLHLVITSGDRSKQRSNEASFAVAVRYPTHTRILLLDLVWIGWREKEEGYLSYTRKHNIEGGKRKLAQRHQKKSSNIERTPVEDHFYRSLFTWRARRKLALEDNAGFVCQAVTTQSIAKRDKTHDGTGRGEWVSSVERNLQVSRVMCFFNFRHAANEFVPGRRLWEIGKDTLWDKFGAKIDFLFL